MRKVSTILVVFAFVGCSVSPSKNPDPVEVTGTVNHGGRPVSDVMINFQVTGAGGQAIIPVKNGEFKGSIVPGKYTYFFTESSSKSAALQAIPEGYRSGSMDRQVEIKAGSTLTISID